MYLLWWKKRAVIGCDLIDILRYLSHAVFGHHCTSFRSSLGREQVPLKLVSRLKSDLDHEDRHKSTQHLPWNFQYVQMFNFGQLQSAWHWKAERVNFSNSKRESQTFQSFQTNSCMISRQQVCHLRRSEAWWKKFEHWLSMPCPPTCALPEKAW